MEGGRVGEQKIYASFFFLIFSFDIDVRGSSLVGRVLSRRASSMLPPPSIPSCLVGLST